MSPPATPDIEESTIIPEEINMTRSLKIIICGAGIGGKLI